MSGDVLRWGLPGHEHEYCLNLGRYDLTGEWFPDDRKLEALLAPYGYYVCNRGSRIEIMPEDWRDEPRPGDTEFVLAAVREVYGESVEFTGSAR